jgi:hypothetical protein
MVWLWYWDGPGCFSSTVVSVGLFACFGHGTIAASIAVDAIYPMWYSPKKKTTIKLIIVA